MKRLLNLLAIATTLCVGVVNAQTPPAITNGLIGLYHLDSTTVIDASGTGRTGTVANATLTTGRFGNALHFNGTNSFVDVGNLDVNSSGQLSVTAWVRSTVPYTSNDCRTVVCKVNNVLGGPFDLFVGDGSSNTSTGGNTAGFASWSNTTPIFSIVPAKSSTKNTRDGSWHHLAITSKIGSQCVYWDGILMKTNSYSSPLPSSTTSVRIGGVNISNHHPWNGDIDEVAIYNRALSSTEIATLAVGPKASTSPASSVIVNVQNYDLTFVIENLSNVTITSQVIKVDGVDRTTEFMSGATTGNITNGKYILIGSPVLTAGSHKIDATFNLSNGSSVKAATVTYRVLASQ